MKVMSRISPAMVLRLNADLAPAHGPIGSANVELNVELTQAESDEGKQRSMLQISPGKEEEFRYFQDWLAASDAVDRVVVATEPATSPVSSRWSTATDMALSQLFDSLKNGASAKVQSRVPDDHPAWSPGGLPCGQTCT